MKLQKRLTTIATTKPSTLTHGARWGFAALVAAWIVSAAAATPATAQIFEGEPIVVDYAGDEVGTEGLTLREALALAEATTDDDMIVFADHISVIQLTQGKLWIGNMVWPPNSGTLIIDGEQRVTIDAGGQSGILDIQSGSVTVKGLELINGYASLGGGLMVWDYANVSLENSVVSGNYATNAGGGIYSIGVLTVIDTVVKHNYSRVSGGGVFIYGGYGGSLVAANSTFSMNEARSGGGGIFNDSAEVILIAPIVSQNIAANGGGIYCDGGHLSITDGEFGGNQVSRKGKGGDIYFTSGSFDPTGWEDLDLFEVMPKGQKGGRK